MYHVSTQGIDECMINVHYYHYDVAEICKIRRNSVKFALTATRGNS